MAHEGSRIAVPVARTEHRPSSAGSRMPALLVAALLLGTTSSAAPGGQVAGAPAAAQEAPAPAADRQQLLASLQQHLEKAEKDIRLDRLEEAIAGFQAAYDMLPALGESVAPELANHVRFRLGVAYMRLGETQNCCARNTPDSCLLPIRGGGLHTEQQGSRQAARYFAEALQNAKVRDLFYLKSMWLLNIAFMTLGEYPDEVPAAWVIRPEAFQSQGGIPRFRNVAAALGVDSFDQCGGAIADDFDGDGYLDLVASSWDDEHGPMRYWRNDGAGGFVDLAEESGLGSYHGGLNMVQADYDGDGDVDILVLRGAWRGPEGQVANSLLRNEGDGTFRDVAKKAGLAETHYPTQTAAWADFDLDGDLDVYIGNEHGGLDAPSQLFRNEGDGTFIDVAPTAGVENRRYAKGVVWGDYDGDRYPDLYVSNLGQENRLYRNEGDGTFTDVAAELGVEGPLHSFPAWFWDFDNDGLLDLFVSSYHGVTTPNAVGLVAASYLDIPLPQEHACLYRGKPGGGFEEVAKARGLTRMTMPMGANFGDLNGDGFPDFYLGTGYDDLEALMPNVMYVNLRGRQFIDVTTAGGFGHLQKGHGVVFADLDNDGDQDVYEQMGGAFPSDRYANALYENPGFRNRWLAVQLVGVESNRSAIGARIRVDVREGGAERSIYKHVDSGGSFGANPLRQTIGLGKAHELVRLVVSWPATDETQTFEDVPFDRFLRIVEGEDEYEVQDLRAASFALGESER